jgi:hypothetical protein
VNDLVSALRHETRYPWTQHVSRSGAAVLFFGEPIPDGPRTVSSHCLVVFGQPTRWHVDVLRLERGGHRALRVPGEMTWHELSDFVTELVPRLGGVSPLYQPPQS